MCHYDGGKGRHNVLFCFFIFGVSYFWGEVVVRRFHFAFSLSLPKVVESSHEIFLRFFTSSAFSGPSVRSRPSSSDQGAKLNYRLLRLRVARKAHSISPRTAPRERPCHNSPPNTDSYLFHFPCSRF